MIIHKTGSLFVSTQPILVNCTNCVGVMGAGIAKEFKQRFPEYYNSYVKSCRNIYECKPGTATFYIHNLAEPDEQKILVSFFTKNDWRTSSTYNWIVSGLLDFVQRFKQVRDNYPSLTTGAAFPLLGCDNRGLNYKQVVPLMENILGQLDAEIEIWTFSKEK